jgi:hypothetical protein
MSNSGPIHFLIVADLTDHLTYKARSLDTQIIVGDLDWPVSSQLRPSRLVNTFQPTPPVDGAMSEGTAINDMRAQTQAVYEELLNKYPDGYPEPVKVPPLTRPTRSGNCIVCVHMRKENAWGSDYLLVEV